MAGMHTPGTNSDTKKTVDTIEKAVYTSIRPYGFQKHGRTLHRFVSDDISQVIHFQMGPAYLEQNHLLFVNVGIRVPECMERSFSPKDTAKTYYPEHMCNIRSRFGVIEGREESCYDLRQGSEAITGDILRQLHTLVIPAFESLSSREAILARRREFPLFDRLNSHLILLEESMILGHQGNPEAAAEAFRMHYCLTKEGCLAQKDPAAIRNHLRYLDGLAAELGIKIR